MENDMKNNDLETPRRRGRADEDSYHPAIEKAVKLVGGQAVLAAKLGVSQATVSKWVRRLNAVKLENALEIERITQGRVRAYEIRPDLGRYMVVDDDVDDRREAAAG